MRAAPILSAAHAYQISSARDGGALQIPRAQGTACETAEAADRLDRRCRLRHRQRARLHQAGVLVVNQTGGNAEAVAQTVLAMVLTLSKRMVDLNHTLRAGTMHDRNAFMGPDVNGRTIGIFGHRQCRAPSSRVVQGPVQHDRAACDPNLDEKTVAALGAIKVEGRTSAPRRLRFDQLSARRRLAQDDRRA